MIDRTGAYLEPPKQGRCGHWTIDAKGNLAMTPEETTSADGLFVHIDGDKHGFADGRGRIVIGHLYDDALDFQEGLGAVKVGKRWGFVDESGTLVIEPRFEEVSSFSQGLAQAKVKVPLDVGGKRKTVTRYGFVDAKGAMAIEPRFTAVDDKPVSFQHGLAAVVLDKAHAYVDRKGTIVWKERTTK